MSFINLTLKLNQFPSLSSERLMFVPLTEKDIDELYELRSDLEVMKYINRTSVKSKAEIAAFINKIDTGVKTGKWVYWKIQQKNNSELIGTICLWLFREDGMSCDIGYELRKNYWGNGYMREAIGVICNFGLEVLGVKKIVALTAKDNSASTRLLSTSGFSKEGLQGNDYIFSKSFV